MTNVLAYIGRNTYELYRYFAGLYEMTAKAVYWTFVAPFRGRSLKWGYALHQMVLVGYNAVPIVFLISFFVGLILALQGAHELVRLGRAGYTMSLVAVAMTREIGPLMTAIGGGPVGLRLRRRDRNHEGDRGARRLRGHGAEQREVPGCAEVPCDAGHNAVFDHAVGPGGHPGWRPLLDASARPEFFPRLAHDDGILGDAGHLDWLDQKPGFRSGHHEGGVLRRIYRAGWRRRCGQVNDGFRR